MVLHLLRNCIDPMRIYLVTPFAEKDAAKALGARWDPGRRAWYVEDPTDLNPFLRWLPVSSSNGNAQATIEPNLTQSGSVNCPSSGVDGELLQISTCDCDVLPWEDCVHTLSSTSPRD